MTLKTAAHVSECDTWRGSGASSRKSPGLARVTGAPAARRITRRGDRMTPNLTRASDLTLAARQTRRSLRCSKREARRCEHRASGVLSKGATRECGGAGD